ncbi:actin-related protein 5-like isoform X1 [Carex littledalei]|uniref:Actin-related protein 5 n=1 Tax=Carex littledalei TaxID=544730 RepID=A0A833R4U6_9POAL|nr:actin-related protein 5-like isoform X1 [Carex littledalei]
MAEARIARQTDYDLFSPTTPIVIDNGGSTFRIGWAGESDPRIMFRNVALRPRHRSTGETVTVVGEHDPALFKYFDCTRSSWRSPFDNNVVYQFEIMEYVLDYGFDQLGASSSMAGKVDHPILMTECILNPVSSRAKMAELLFETYGAPSVAFGVDAAFSYKYNQNLGICAEDGIALSVGYMTSHSIPFLKGEPLPEGSCRTNVGGYHVTNYLKELLSLKYPYHASSITWEKSEELKREHCYVAPDYASELQIFKKGTKESEEKKRVWQLPWIPPPQEEPPSEEELARKAAIREKQGQRLREMAAAKRSQKITDLENELHVLETLLSQLEQAEQPEVASSILARSGYLSRQEIESAHFRVSQSLRKARGEPTGTVEDNADNVTSADKYPLVSIPDEMLTPDQLKEKKRQLFLKTTSEGRLRAKQKRSEEEMMRERQNQLEEERRLENPELYLEELRAKYKELSEKMDQRKRLKTNGNGNGNGNNVSGGTGRGERLNAAQRERMRLLTTALYDKGKGEDTFGLKDEDWQLYKLMSKDTDDDDDVVDPDEAELERVATKLQEFDPSFVERTEARLMQSAQEPPRPRTLTAEDYQVVLGVERFRCPEVLFQPGMVGEYQVGLDEMVSHSLRRLPNLDSSVKDHMCQSIFLTGGGSLLPGLEQRLETGIRATRPYLSPLKIVRAVDSVMDAWRGASVYAASEMFSTQIFSLQDYNEKGEDWLRRYNIVYSLYD